jgi:hypothetical protein
VLRILQAKEKLGLHESRVIEPGDMATEEAIQLKRRLFQEAVTQVGPLPGLNKRAAYLSFGDGDVLSDEFEVAFEAPLQLDLEHKKALLGELRPFDQVIIALHQADLKVKGYGLSNAALELIDELSDRSIFCHFATPYALFSHKSLLIGYENDPMAQRAVFDILRGKETPKGRLPVSKKSPG